MSQILTTVVGVIMLLVIGLAPFINSPGFAAFLFSTAGSELQSCPATTGSPTVNVNIGPARDNTTE